MRKAIPRLMMLGGLLFGAGSIWAVPPDQGEDTFSFAESFVADCSETFSICEGGDIYLRWKYFFDSNGVPKKYTEKYKFDGLVYECGNPANGLPYNPISYTFGYDFASGEYFAHGLWAMLIVPGYGQIFRDVGHFAYRVENDELIVVFEAGEHQWFYQDVTAVCEMLMSGP